MPIAVHVGAISRMEGTAIGDLARRFGKKAILVKAVQDRTPRELILEGPLSLRETLDLLIQVAHGLAAVHAHGIVHPAALRCRR